MAQPKKLIEVAMPIKEISAESVRDKSIRHGHISTLHLWWARRPLPVCRAVIFASLVPDPLDKNCSAEFKSAVEKLLGAVNNQGDPYKPYDDIPFTAAHDRMEDNLRNRLLMFIGKFSEEYARNEKAGKITPSGKVISDSSLIKWDSKKNEEIIGKARKLIWVAHNAKGNKSIQDLLAAFDAAYAAIKDAESSLYNTIDRHLLGSIVKERQDALDSAIEAFLENMPKVFDPFAGGGAIPMEAARLGCRTFGNDINPVAHIIQKGSLEFPQKFGKPIVYTKNEFINKYDEDAWNEQPYENKKIKNGEAIEVTIENRLAYDVAYFADKLFNETSNEISYLYPPGDAGNNPVAYYWARVGNCSNPTCKAEVPLLRGFYLANTKSKKIYLRPLIKGNKIDFEIAYGTYNEEEVPGWLKSANLTCPCCGSFTEVKKLREQFKNKETKERLLVIIYEGKKTKEYRLPSKEQSDKISNTILNVHRPTEKLPIEHTGKFPRPWGFETWGDIFSNRQLFAMQTLIKHLDAMKEELKDEYGIAVVTYLGMLIDKICVLTTNLGRWDNTTEHGQSPFSRQAMAMTFDYPEYNPFFIYGAQLEWILRFIYEESPNSFSTQLRNSSSGEKSQFKDKYLTAVVTDPPYYDAIPYADLSDFFYVWLKRTLGDIYPLNFATPQTPKSEECTALKHNHGGSIEKAKDHFENKLLQIFDSIEHQTSDIVSIMFAHQSTEAWTTLCNSILGARMNITGSWAIDTELSNRPLALAKSALASSVTVSCRPSQRKGEGSYKQVKKDIEETVQREVEELYHLGFRGADLLTACFGQAVSEFGRYTKVEKADGSNVTVAELLEMARESAFNALLKGFDGDDCTKFYIGWLQLYGFVETEFDDAAKFSRVGLTIDVSELFKEDILIKHGNKQALGTYRERLKANKNLGERSTNYLIDEVHKAMALYEGTNRNLLLQYIAKIGSQPESGFWRVVTSLCEILPGGSEDHKQALGLLTNKDSLIRESKTVKADTSAQANLFEQ
jgi:putative DNA methylase